MDDDFLQVQDGGGVIKGFGVALIDHGLKDGDLLWFRAAMLLCRARKDLIFFRCLPSI